MKILMRLLVGVSFVVISACGGSSGGGGDDAVAAPVNDNPCGTVVDIDPDSMVDGKLEAGDCRLIDLDPATGDQTFADEYRVTLTVPGTLTITMRSADLDAFLVLQDRATSCSGGCTAAEAMVITVNDDGGGGVNGQDALIMRALVAGTYIIVANSVVPVTAVYTLETTFVP